MPKEKMIKSLSEWRKQLTDEQYRILFEKGTEMPGTGEYEHNKDPGDYICAACGTKLFVSDHKFDSGSGWPSFDRPADAEAVEMETDATHGMVRTEVKCSVCGGHLGHVFSDGPKDTTCQRFCINSAALKFMPKETSSEDGTDR